MASSFADSSGEKTGSNICHQFCQYHPIHTYRLDSVNLEPIVQHSTRPAKIYVLQHQSQSLLPLCSAGLSTACVNCSCQVPPPANPVWNKWSPIRRS